MKNGRSTKLFKRILYYLLLGVMFCFTITFSFLAISSGSIADQTVKKNEMLLADFELSAKFVDSFMREFHRLPDKNEFEVGLQKNGISNQILLNQSTTELPIHFGHPPKESYYLSYWRGEWEEFYASWSKQHTLIIERERYYPFGSSKLTYLLAIFSITCFLLLLFFLKRI